MKFLTWMFSKIHRPTTEVKLEDVAEDVPDNNDKPDEDYDYVPEDVGSGPDPVWQSGWLTDEGIEGRALVGESREGFHTCLSIAEYNREYDTLWSEPYPTKQEAIDAAKRQLYAWHDSHQEILLDRQESQIAEYKRAQTEAAVSDSTGDRDQVDRDDDPWPGR